jgi:hypothetical protein
MHTAASSNQAEDNAQKVTEEAASDVSISRHKYRRSEHQKRKEEDRKKFAMFAMTPPM